MGWGTAQAGRLAGRLAMRFRQRGGAVTPHGVAAALVCCAAAA